MQRGDVETGVWSRPIGNSFRLPEQVLLRSYAGTQKCPPGPAGASVRLRWANPPRQLHVVGPQAVQIAFGPGGIVVLWLLAAGLAGLALWRLIEATSTCPPGSPPSPGQPFCCSGRSRSGKSPAALRLSPAIAAVSAGRHGGRPGGKPQPEPQLPASAEAGTWRRLIALVSGRGSGPQAGSKARNTGGRMRARPAATSRRRCRPPSGRPRPAPWSAPRWTAPRL